ncbi:hypothetical protein JT55_10290 [Rhodovulum sp. NI22]|nr:hypothetical protein JT55_10290 [Rhodovulum sp. NI22]
MSELGYLRQKLFEATLSLAGPGALDERLAGAGMALVAIRDNYSFKNDNDRDRFLAVRQQLTAPVDDATDGYIAANVARMSGVQREELAGEIVSLLYMADL